MSTSRGPRARPIVLLVDDQPANLLVLEAVLTRLDVDLIRAQTGERAIEIVSTTPCAAVVLDDRLPDMRGVDVARGARIRLGARCPPIILYTASDFGRAELAAWRTAGVEEVLQKPTDPDVLRGRVAALVGRSRPREAEQTTTSRRC